MDRIISLLEERGLDALLVSDLVNVRWLTGFSTSNAAVVVARDRAVLVTDFRYAGRAAREARDVEVREGKRDLLGDLMEALPEGRIGFEDQATTVARHARLREAAGAGRELVGVGDALEALRAVKTPEELARMRAAAALADATLRAVLERGLVGRRERDVVADLEAELRRRGAQRGSFDPMVASGPRSDAPHSEAGDAEIGRDTLVMIDFGVELDGWCSDGTRTFATGELDGERRDVYALVQRAQAAGLDAVRAGAVGREVDGAARSIIDAAGHGDRFGHGLGHGVGMRIHEEPRLTRESGTVLVPGHVVSVEPGVYLPGRFGVRIEDVVAVTDDGYENLASLPKDLTVID